MDWPTIHAYAEEAELWTTLAINVWLIIGAISFVLYNPGAALEPLGYYVARSVLWGFIGLCIISGPAILSLTAGMERSSWQRLGDISALAFCFGFPAYGAYILVTRLKKC